MLNYSSYTELSKDLHSGNISCEDVVNYYLKIIATKNKSINAYIEVFDKEAIDRARLIDKKIKNKSAGKLAGFVIGIKDNICYKNHTVTASSKILTGFKSLYSATVVEKLISEDAIILGRLNCDEFAMGSANENSIYGSVRNPHNLEKVAGGSSGGSAAAVASGMCLAALGSDTGGSIRQPSAFCGVIGLKPTYSRVSRNGLIAYASSFDQIGPICRSVSDAALLLEVIAGLDPLDSTSSSRMVDNYSNFESSTKKMKIAVLKEYLTADGMDNEIKIKTKEFINKLQAKGHNVSYISFPYLEYLVPTYYVLTTAEASSNLARYDGVHYGHRSVHSNNLEETYFKSRSEGFGEEVKRRIMTGTFVLSAGYQDEYYTKAQKVRRLVFDRTEEILQSYDLILTPTTPHTAFDLNNCEEDPTVMYLEDIFTVQANITGHPSITLPLFRHSNGLPFGVQFTSNKFSEKELLNFSNLIIKKFL